MQKNILRVVSRVPGADTVKRVGAKVRATAARSAKKAAIGTLALAGVAGLAWMSTQARHHANDTVTGLISAAGAGELAGEHVLGAAQSLLSAFDDIKPEEPHPESGLRDATGAMQGATLVAATPAVGNDASHTLVTASSNTTWSYTQCGGTIVGAPVAFMIAMVAIVRLCIYTLGPTQIARFCDLAIWIVTCIAMVFAGFARSKQERHIVGLVAVCLFLATNMGGERIALQQYDAKVGPIPLSATHEASWVGIFIGQAFDAQSIARAIFEVGGHGAMHKIRIGGQKLDDVLNYLSMPNTPKAADDAMRLVCDVEAFVLAPFTQAGMSDAAARQVACQIMYVLDANTRRIVVETLISPSAGSDERGILLDFIEMGAHGNATQLIEKLSKLSKAKSEKTEISAPQLDEAATFARFLQTDGQVVSGIALGLPSIAVYGSLGSPAAAKIPQVPTWKALVEGKMVETIAGTGKETPAHGAVRVIRGMFAQSAVGICKAAVGIIGTNGTQATYDEGTGVLTLPADSGSKLDVSFFEVYQAIISPVAIEVPVLAYALAFKSVDFDSIARSVPHQQALAVSAKLAAVSSYLSAELSKITESRGVIDSEGAPDREAAGRLASAIAETRAITDYAFRVPEQLSWVPASQKPRLALVGASLGRALGGIHKKNATSAEQIQSAWSVVALIPSIRNPDIRPESLTRLWTSLSPAVTELPQFTMYLLASLKSGVQDAQQWYQRVLASGIEEWRKANPAMNPALDALAADHAAQRFHSIYMPHVEAAQDVLNLDLARKLAIEESAGQPTLAELRTRLDVLQKAQKEITNKNTADASDADLASYIDTAATEALVHVNAADANAARETTMKDDFLDFVEKYKDYTPSIKVSKLIVYMAARAGKLKLSHWYKQREVWEESGLVTEISDTLVANIFREVLKLPRFKENINPWCVDHVLRMLPPASAAEVDTVDTMRSVVDGLAKSATCTNTGPKDTEEAQACDATRLIIDMLNLAIEKQASLATGRPGSFGATRTRKGMPVPRRFL
jgi:hypothetical protein